MVKVKISLLYPEGRRKTHRPHCLESLIRLRHPHRHAARNMSSRTASDTDDYPSVSGHAGNGRHLEILCEMQCCTRYFKTGTKDRFLVPSQSLNEFPWQVLVVWKERAPIILLRLERVVTLTLCSCIYMEYCAALSVDKIKQACENIWIELRVESPRQHLLQLFAFDYVYKMSPSLEVGGLNSHIEKPKCLLKLAKF